MMWGTDGSASGCGMGWVEKEGMGVRVFGGWGGGRARRAWGWAVLGAALAVGALPASGQETVAITNATIHTVSGDVIERGTIVLRDGLIAAVGANVSVPAEARRIDGTGKVVTPGFVDSFSQIGLVEIGGSAEGTNDHTTSEESLNASFNPIWGVNPRNTLIPNNRIRGLTGAVVHPGGSKLFPGQGALIALDGATLEEMTRSESVAVYAVMGEAGASTAGGSRAANYIRLRDALSDAQTERAEREASDEAESAGEEEVEEAEERRSGITGADLDALVRVAAGELPLVVAADRESDIRLALRLHDEFDIRLILLGAREGWRVADGIAAAEVAVIVNPLVNLPDFEGLSATWENAGRLQQAGVEVILSTFSSHQIRDLTYGAGLAVSYGMDHDAALRAVTLAPALAWGGADRMGSLEAGRIADVVVWSGDPFELSTSAEHVFIGGTEVPMDSRQERLFERYRVVR